MKSCQTTAWGFLAISLCLFFVSCAHVPYVAPIDESVASPPPLEFEERLMTPVATCVVERTSAYPELFSSISQALCLTPRILRERAEAEAIALPEPSSETPETTGDDTLRNFHDRFIAFELHTVSNFADAGIASEMVKLSEVDIFLVDGKGRMYAPVRMVIGPVEEDFVGALRRFSRTNLLVFLRDNPLTKKPLFEPDTTWTRLELHAFESRFFFDWSLVSTQIPPQEKSLLRQRAETSYSELKRLFKTILYEREMP
ncbi:hypothetical protein ACFL1X_00500 [Candidatus Hydrogenedentota bacterium]